MLNPRHHAGKLCFGAVLALCAPGSAVADTDVADTDVAELVRRSAATYSDIETYEITGKMRIEMNAGGRTQTMDANITLHGRPPHEQRVDIDHPMMGSLWIGTEYEVITYMKPMKRFMRFTAEDLQGAGAELRRMGPSRFAELADHASSMTFISHEELTTDDGALACVKVATPTELAEASPGLEVLSYTLWIDPETSFVHQARMIATGQNPQMGVKVEMKQTITYDDVVVNGPLNQALFTFEPPEGVTETTPEELSGGAAPASKLTGNPATPFELTTLTGDQIALDDLKGKVVLIDFWATWCAPCRREMPHVQKLYEEHGDDDLVVLAVSQEREPVVRAYIEKNGFTFPTLVDSDGAVNRAYGVSALPTLVIVDREGMVSDHFVGLRSETTLRSALERAGL